MEKFYCPSCGKEERTYNNYAKEFYCTACGRIEELYPKGFYCECGELIVYYTPFDPKHCPSCQKERSKE